MVVHIQTCHVGDHVVGFGGTVVHPRHAGRVIARGVGADGKAGLLPRLHAADIGLIDGHFQAQFLQVFGHGEQGDGLQRGRHGIARIDRACEHHPIDGRLDRGFGQVGFHRHQRSLGVVHTGLGSDHLGLGALQSGTACVQLSRRGQFAPRDAPHLFQALQVGLGLAQRCLRLRQTRLGRGQRRTRTPQLGIEFGGIQFHQHLTFAHLIVHIHQHAAHGARQLRADVHGACGLQRAVGRHRQGQVAAMDLLAHIQGLGLGRRAVLPPHVAACGHSNSGSAQPQGGAFPPAAL